jgi:hypothetical protein
MFRILLKHPYQRQPPFAMKPLLTRASNVTINDVYEVPPIVKKQMSGAELNLPSGLCFEEYYSLLKDTVMPFAPSDGRGIPNDVSEAAQGEGESCELSEFGETCANSGNSRSTQGKLDAQISELWEEDESACCDINGFIEIAEASNNWGSISKKLQGVIRASKKVNMDYRKMLSLFKTSVISSKRRLTRMRPNRRFGFDAMGSRYELSTNLLIAVDVSGSVTDKNLQFFFSVINRLFKYGV